MAADARNKIPLTKWTTAQIFCLGRVHRNVRVYVITYARARLDGRTFVLLDSRVTQSHVITRKGVVSSPRDLDVSPSRPGMP